MKKTPSTRTKKPTAPPTQQRTAPHAVAQWVSELPPERRDIVEALRGIVLGAVPGLTEAMKWNAPAYELHGPICYIQNHKGSVNFGFFRRGIDLEDPDGLLEGTGKAMRHVKLRSREDLDSARFAAWVKQAATLDHEAP